MGKWFRTCVDAAYHQVEITTTCVDAARPWLRHVQHLIDLELYYPSMARSV